MKDYLNSNERLNLLLVNHLIGRLDELIDGLTKTKNITGPENKSFKTASTLLKKAIASIVGRQNKSSCKTLTNEMDRSQFIVETHSAIAKYTKKKSAQIDAAYKENKEYYKLVELIMHYNCRNCNKCANDCEFYHEFEEQYIPDLDGAIHNEGCKYSFKE